MRLAVWGSISLTIVYISSNSHAAVLQTWQNSTLSVPAAGLVSASLTGATNLAGSNLLLSVVMSGTLHGGHASLRISERWMQHYGFPTIFQDGAAYTIVPRPDGSVVVSGPSNGSGTGDDFATVCYASDGSPVWTNRYDGPNHGSDSAYVLATDTNGNVWVAGQSMRYATNSTLTDAVVIKYATNGIPLWTNIYNSFQTNGSAAGAIRVDRQGNAYVWISAAYWEGYSGTHIEEAIIKYDASGNAEWTNHYFAAAPDSGNGLHGCIHMALDNAGNLFVAGDTGSQHMRTGHSVIKFDGDGIPIWTNHHPFEPYSSLESLSVDHSGNPLVTGETFGLVGDSYVNYFVMKLSQTGDTLWTNRLAGPLYDGGSVPCTMSDPVGNVFLIGGTPGSLPGLYRILKISSDGVPLWTNQNANFSTTNGAIHDAAVDIAGNLYMTGHVPATNGERDWITMKFSGNGEALWTNRFNGTANQEDIASALAVSSAGEVYVTGRTELQNGKRAFATLKYADLLFYSPPKDFTGVDTITCTLTDYLGNSATGTVDVIVSPGAFGFTVRTNATRMTSLGLHLKVEGTPGTNAVILEASADSITWQPLSTNTPVQGSIQLIDSSAFNSPRRFYRAIQSQ